MIEFLDSQKHRMSEQQKNLVERLANIPDDQWQKVERERMSVLYLWLHMSDGSVSDRKFASKAKRR